LQKSDADSMQGTVPVIVTNNGLSSASVNATLQQVGSAKS
jgi:hypothetical protein